MISGVTISGNNIVVAMKSHVTQTSCDTVTTRSMFSASPVNLVSGTSSKTITVTSYTGGNTVVSPATGQVRFKLIFTC